MAKGELTVNVKLELSHTRQLIIMIDGDRDNRLCSKGNTHRCSCSHGKLAALKNEAEKDIAEPLMSKLRIDVIEIEKSSTRNRSKKSPPQSRRWATQEREQPLK